ncbi:MAG TPA: hypothetical protein VF668_02150 [Pyrinomonadaceae bacterium]|jgi:hypothetical protein
MSDAAEREQTNTETEADAPGLRVPFSEGGGALASAGGARPARAWLARLVACKLALDLLFVGAFALYTHAGAFRGGFDGALEHADVRGARGWVVDLERPGAAVEVQLFVDGRFAASTVAEELRSDTPEGTPHGAGRRGFTFDFGGGLRGEHEARVYAVRESRGGARRTLHEVGGRLRLAWK